MNIFSVLSLCGGLAFFLFGINTMSDSLEKLAESKLEIVLRRLTANPLKSLFLGIGITAAIQSSSAVTVMLVSLVNSGIITLSQSIGVIMGANIGTTVTAWLLSLTGISGTALWINLLKPENFSLGFALIGVIFLMITKKPKFKHIGLILIGFAVLMYGMELMSRAVEPFAKSDTFT
ncbi:MAG: Na/Pi symporter, partial [Christensenellaceae bacterium]|nr:Na/Pi symporter [Christensenellaceae bacterium]